jgi:hypothetical protein
MTKEDIILLALDEIEEVRQQSHEKPIDDYDLRVLAANVARLFDNIEMHNRANWTDKLKEDTDSKYYKRYYHGLFHV